MTFSPTHSQAADLVRSKEFAQARMVYRQILQAQPGDVASLRGLASIASRCGNYADLVEDLCTVQEASPNMHLVFYLIGYALCKLGRFSEGVECFDKAVVLAPNTPNYLCDRASALAELHRHDEALEGYDQAIALDSKYADAFVFRGSSLFALGKVDAAIASFTQAIALRPNSPAAYLNKANAYLHTGRFALAIRCYEHAIDLQAHYPMAYTNRSVALKGLHRLQDALGSIEKALAQEPNYLDALWNKALTQLLAGNLSEGFSSYLVRWQTEVFKPVSRQFQKPLWLGESPIAGKRLLVHNEQGLGDSIQFCRFVSQAAQAGAQLIYEVEPALFGLMQSLPGVHTLLRQRDPLPPFDYYCPVMSLPVALGTTLETIPGHGSYLRAAPDKVAQWALRLGKKTSPRIGLAWSGSLTHKADHQRSIALSQLLSALPAGLSYFSLQKELRPTDAAVLGANPQIAHFGDEIQDFSDTAAICQAMDLVIAVDTSIAHLGGALGVPTWVLLPHTPDWRWLLEREDSPWYASLGLIRQSRVNVWGDVLRVVHNRLQQYL